MSQETRTTAAGADFVSEVVHSLVKHLDARAQLLARLEILADLKQGDRTGANLAAAKLLRTIVEGARAVQEVGEGAPRRKRTR